jgi:pimeloyl-ACP methyl ester carboxylesterase
MKIGVNGIVMNYEIAGKGKVLVLIHGAGDNLHMWYKQVPIFSKTYTVITYDIRGHGETETSRAEYSIELFTQDLYEFMKAIKVESSYFLGYSMGGRIALNLAINHPEIVKALIFTNSPAGLIPPAPESIERRRVWLELLEKGDVKAVAEMMTAIAFSPGFEDRSPTEFNKYRNIKLQNNPGCFARAIRAIGTLTTPPDLKKVKCPVLIIVGENDPIAGVDQGSLTQKAIVGSQLVILPTGHTTAIELPEKFNSVVMEFLSATTG